MKRGLSHSSRSGLELMEEATHLLRTAPAGTLASYYVGSIPFVLGFLHFWADMSRSPFATQHVAEASLLITALFLWMKFCQTIFAQRILAHAAARPTPSWNVRQVLRVFLSQAVIQPTGFFVLPLAFVIALPFGWVYAFYQNVTVLDDGRSDEISGLIKRAWKQASLWPLQNHIAMGATSLFGLCVFLNWFVVGLSVPRLVKLLFGIDSMFTRSPLSMLNTTFVAAIVGLTYLVLDPILKTAYALRCFYGEALNSGEDLKAQLKQFPVTPQHWIAMLIVSISIACGSAALAQAPTTEAAAPAVSAAELDKQIDQVIHETKYAWRMPRVDLTEDESEKGMISRFLDGIGRVVRSALRTGLDWIEAWLRDRLRDEQSRPATGVFDLLTSSWLVYFLVGAQLGLLGVFFVRVWQRRPRPVVSASAEAIQRSPDVSDESVGADQLPEDEWIALAHSLLERGEFRLAMRAFYLSALANLARNNLISIARFKSNRDYQTELRRRAHALPELPPVFEESVFMFERIWYGLHEVNMEGVHQFASNVEKITGMKTLGAS
jgi:hypothetical protein